MWSKIACRLSWNQEIGELGARCKWWSLCLISATNWGPGANYPHVALSLCCPPLCFVLPSFYSPYDVESLFAWSGNVENLRKPFTTLTNFLGVETMWMWGTSRRRCTRQADGVGEVWHSWLLTCSSHHWGENWLDTSGGNGARLWWKCVRKIQWLAKARMSQMFWRRLYLPTSP